MLFMSDIYKHLRLSDVREKLPFLWENGKCGYFIQNDPNLLGEESSKDYNDNQGLRFFQIGVDGEKIHDQSNEIIISGFGEYFILRMEKEFVAEALYETYTFNKLRASIYKWKIDNNTNKINNSIIIDLAKNIQIIELRNWQSSTICLYFNNLWVMLLELNMSNYFIYLEQLILNFSNLDSERFIKNIKNSTVTGGLGWANGLFGQFRDFENDYQLRFCETDQNCYHNLLKEEDQIKSPVLACGFVAWLIKHWGTDTLTIYSGYLQTRLNQYKSAHKNDADVLKRDLDSEFFEQYNSLEEKLVLQSEAIFNFISDNETNKIKNYIDNYFDFIHQYLPYKIYNSFDEAIRECDIEDKILLHSITKFLNPSYRSPINIFNDILQIKAMYLKEPSKCIKYIRDNYNNTTADEYYILIHILKSKLDRDSDLQILLPDISAKKSLTDSFDDLLRSIRRKLTVHFDVNRGVLLIDESDPSKIYTTLNLTDEIALHFLSTQPETRKHFYLLPPNVDELIEEYKFKQSVNANSDLSSKSKGQKSKHVKDDLNKQFAEREIKVLEFEQYFKPSFRGIGEYNINHFVSLIEDLKQNRSAKEFAEIALLIHESKHMNSRKPVYFTEWYQVFCECVGCEQKKYDPKDLRPIRESVKNLFGYLLI